MSLLNQIMRRIGPRRSAAFAATGIVALALLSPPTGDVPPAWMPRSISGWVWILHLPGALPVACGALLFSERGVHGVEDYWVLIPLLSWFAYYGVFTIVFTSLQRRTGHPGKESESP